MAQAFQSNAFENTAFEAASSSGGGSLPVFRNSSQNRFASTSSPLSLTKPTGALENDALILIYTQDGQGLSATPSGGSAWTLLGTQQVVTNGDVQTIWVWTKIAGASEPANYTLTVTNGNSSCYTILAYSSVDTASLIDVSSVINPNLGSPPSSPVTMTANAVTTTVANAMLVYIGMWDKSGSSQITSYTPPAGYTHRVTESENNNFGALFVDEKAQATAGASGTPGGVVTLSSTAGNYVVYLIALKPAAGGGGSVSLSPNAAAQSQLSTSPTITQANNLAPNNVAQAQLIGSPAIVQAGNIAPLNNTQAQLTSSPTLDQSALITAANLFQAQLASIPAITQANNLSPNNGVQSQISGSPSLNQANVLTALAVVQAQLASVPTLTQANSLAPSNNAQAQLASSPSMSVAGALSVAGNAQAQLIASPSINAQYQLTANSAVQAQLIGSPTLSTLLVLSPNPVLQAAAISLPSLSVSYVIAPNNVFQLQSALNAGLFLADIVPPDSRRVRFDPVSRITFALPRDALAFMNAAIRVITVEQQDRGETVNKTDRVKGE